MQPSINSENEDLLTPEDVSKALKVSMKTLSNWRSTNRVQGLKFVHIGNAVRYRPADVKAFIEANVKSGGKPDPATVELHGNPRTDI